MPEAHNPKFILLTCPSLALLFYDLSLTLSVEIQKIWSRRFSLVALLYYLNRYVPIAGYAVILVFMYSPGLWSPDVRNPIDLDCLKQY